MPPGSTVAAKLVPAQAPLQSALQAHGDAAAQILEITTVLAFGGGAILLLVMALLAVALAGPEPLRRRLARPSCIVAAGIALPGVVLSLLMLYTFAATAAMGEPRAAPPAVRLQVIGELWWWRVRYLDAGGAALLETANEIHIPVGQPVDLQLLSREVIHSFWVPSLAGKLDMIPGRVTRLRLRAREAGTFRGQCAEYCGAQHAKMALHVVALPPREFAAWLAARQEPAAALAAALPQRGSAVFARARCGVCHTIRGTAEDGTLGPDLTHIGSRAWLAAGSVPAGPQALADWIRNAQHLKPGSRMPAYAGLADDELAALTAYLQGLR